MKRPKILLTLLTALGAACGPLTYIAQTFTQLNRQNNDDGMHVGRFPETVAGEHTTIDFYSSGMKMRPLLHTAANGTGITTRTAATKQIQGYLNMPKPNPNPNPNRNPDPNQEAHVLEVAPVSAFSYSIYGNNTKYTQGMIEAAEQIPKLFPSWQVRVYYDASVPSKIIGQLSQMRHVKLINVSQDLPEWVRSTVHPTAYRFLVASDPSVGVYAIRDSDSRPSKRERAAIEEWLESGKDFHIMRDSPFHRPIVMGPILAGMWGGRHGSIPNMDYLLREYYSTPRPVQYAQDQTFLWETLMPRAFNRTWQHDSFSCVETGGIAFPMTRQEAGDPDDFVGRPHFANLPPNMKSVDPLMKKPHFVEREKLCLQIRGMIIAQAEKMGKAFPSDIQTVYKGNLTGSSVDAYRASGGRRDSIYR